MLTMNRFRVPEAEAGVFRSQVAAAVDLLRNRPGCESIDLVKNLDDPQLWCLVARWTDVGSYRRAFSGVEARLALIPVLSLALDEPGAYDLPEDVGENRPRAR